MTIILKHTDNNSTEQLDKLFTTIDLKKVLSNYKRDTNLGAISKMNKKQLIKVLHDLQFKLHNIKDGDNLIYTFNLSQYDYDPDDPIKINKPLSKPKEIKPKPSKVVKPKLSITQQNISEYDKTMKFLDSNIEKLKNIPFGSIKRVNNPTKNYYDYFVNQIMVNGTGTGNQENYVKRAEYSIKYNKLILDDAKKILNKPSKKIDTPKTEEIKQIPLIETIKKDINTNLGYSTAIQDMGKYLRETKILFQAIRNNDSKTNIKKLGNNVIKIEDNIIAPNVKKYLIDNNISPNQYRKILTKTLRYYKNVIKPDTKLKDKSSVETAFKELFNIDLNYDGKNAK